MITQQKGNRRHGGGNIVTNVYTAPCTIRRRLDDGRQVNEIVEGQTIDLNEALRRGFIDENGQVTDYGRGESERPDWSKDDSLKFSTAVSTRGREMDPETGLPVDHDMSEYGANAKTLISNQMRSLEKLRAASRSPKTAAKTAATDGPPKTGENDKTNAGGNKPAGNQGNAKK